MKTPRRLKLPAIGDGTLIADRAGTEHDFYDSLSIEHESSDFSSSSETLTDESSPSPSFRPSLTNAIIAQRCWAKTVIDKWKNELHGAANIQEKEDPKSMTFNPKGRKLEDFNIISLFFFVFISLPCFKTERYLQRH